MDIMITAINFKLHDSLKAFVKEKVGKLDNHSNTIIRANVILKEGVNGNIDDKQCEIRLIIPGYDHFVRKSTEVYEKSISQAVEALQKIIRRRKSRVIGERYSTGLLCF